LKAYSFPSQLQIQHGEQGTCVYFLVNKVEAVLTEIFTSCRNAIFHYRSFQPFTHFVTLCQLQCVGAEQNTEPSGSVFCSAPTQTQSVSWLWATGLADPRDTPTAHRLHAQVYVSRLSCEWWRVLDVFRLHMRFEVITAVKMLVLRFWVATPCGLAGR
jgi:hypothetical protein